MRPLLCLCILASVLGLAAAMGRPRAVSEKAHNKKSEPLEAPRRLSEGDKTPSPSSGGLQLSIDKLEKPQAAVLFPENCLRGNRKLPCVVVWMPAPAAPPGAGEKNEASNLYPRRSKKLGHSSVCLVLSDNAPCSGDSYFSFHDDKDTTAPSLQVDVDQMGAWLFAFPLFQLDHDFLLAARNTVLAQLEHNRGLDEQARSRQPPSTAATQTMEVVVLAYIQAGANSKPDDPVRLATECAKAANDVVKGADKKQQIEVMAEWLIFFFTNIDSQSMKYGRAKGVTGPISQAELKAQKVSCSRAAMNLDGKDSFPVVPYTAQQMCGAGSEGVPVQVVVDGPADNPFARGKLPLPWHSTELRRIRFGMGMTEDNTFTPNVYVGFHKLPVDPKATKEQREEVPRFPPANLQAVIMDPLKCETSGKGLMCVIPLTDAVLEQSTDVQRPHEERVALDDVRVVVTHDQFLHLLLCFDYVRRYTTVTRQKQTADKIKMAELAAAEAKKNNGGGGEASSKPKPSKGEQGLVSPLSNGKGEQGRVSPLSNGNGKGEQGRRPEVEVQRLAPRSNSGRSNG